MRKFLPRRDRFQRNYGNRNQMQACTYNPPANTSNFRTNEGQNEGQKHGQPGGNERVNRFRQEQSRGNTETKPQIPSQCTRCRKLHSDKCRMGMNVCYAWGKEGHFAMSCLNKRKERERTRT